MQGDKGKRIVVERESHIWRYKITHTLTMSAIHEITTLMKCDTRQISIIIHNTIFHLVINMPISTVQNQPSTFLILWSVRSGAQTLFILPILRCLDVLFTLVQSLRASVSRSWLNAFSKRDLPSGRIGGRGSDACVRLPCSQGDCAVRPYGWYIVS